MPPCDSSDVANRILLNIHRRERSDVIIEPLLVLVVMFSFLLVVNYATFHTLSVTSDRGGALDLFFSLSLYLALHFLMILAAFYLLMSRNEKHSQRERELRSLLIEYVRCRAEETSVENELRSMIEIDRQIAKKEKPAPSVLTAFLIGLPLFAMVLMVEPAFTNIALSTGAALYVIACLVLLYAMWNVTDFPRKHEREWIRFQKAAVAALEKMGVNGLVPMRKTVGIRSFTIFLLISVITAGLFFSIWTWLLLRDMNAHFQEQWAFEWSLIESLRKNESGTA
ncbi:MAG: hypothetical protein PWQ88_499 [Candidatus Methanomethylophilaceae archaeon]|nr:hypothetical protein [Candidatus Methanomethylophilaceae archaeon]MDI3541431.1 hypothetical protein [Candidatus Methanomethylophilaceae archaeon]HIJ00598.1 hypothetical protein [Candidatus Methanomethylophilaceae archaeon]